MSLWEENCTFSDPFTYFGGNNSLKRFKTNADNFSKFIRNPISKVTSVELIEQQPLPQKSYTTIAYDAVNENVDIIKVNWTFKSTLSFPWRPILAASGETSHYISNKSGKIMLYEERWKSNKLDVIKRIFIPGRIDAST